MYITVILTATEFDNWFHLRDHADAQPELAWVAGEMHQQCRKKGPVSRIYRWWHLPLVDDEEWLQVPGTPEQKLEFLRKVSVGRCARISYLTHDGKRDMAKDVELRDQLAHDGHWSPFEHVAMTLRWR
jgi:thymidylate synthase ThyX